MTTRLQKIFLGIAFIATIAGVYIQGRNDGGENVLRQCRSGELQWERARYGPFKDGAGKPYFCVQDNCGLLVRESKSAFDVEHENFEGMRDLYMKANDNYDKERKLHEEFEAKYEKEKQIRKLIVERFVTPLTEHAKD